MKAEDDEEGAIEAVKRLNEFFADLLHERDELKEAQKSTQHLLRCELERSTILGNSMNHQSAPPKFDQRITDLLHASNRYEQEKQILHDMEQKILAQRKKVADMLELYTVKSIIK